MPAKKPKPRAQKKRTVKTSDPAQSERFVKMAKELGADDGGEAFDRAIGVLIPPRKK